jgi:DNA-binding FadR family transcriptional regulator
MIHVAAPRGSRCTWAIWSVLPSASRLLPPEHVMLETYETGRGTLREALRLLEFQGTISLKPSPGGGPVLMIPPASNLASTVMLLMHLNQARYRAIAEVRKRRRADDQPLRHLAHDR